MGGIWAQGKLKKTPLDGGTPVVLCDATDELRGDCGPDGSIVASLGGNKLWRIPASGGVPTVLLDATNEKTSPLWPQVLPNGDLLFTNVGLTGPNAANIDVVSPVAPSNSAEILRNFWCSSCSVVIDFAISSNAEVAVSAWEQG